MTVCPTATCTPDGDNGWDRCSVKVDGCTAVDWCNRSAGTPSEIPCDDDDDCQSFDAGCNSTYTCIRVVGSANREQTPPLSYARYDQPVRRASVARESNNVCD